MNTKRITILFIGLLLITSQIMSQDDASNLLGNINTLRSSLGVHEYSYSSILSAAANNQAQWMVGTGQVSHTQTDGSTPRSRALALGYPSSAVSENIYMGGLATSATAWQWWLNSSIHYQGITSPNYTEVGIGSASGEYGKAYVLVFGNPNGWGVPPGGGTSSQSNTNNGNSGTNNAEAGNNNVPPSYVVGNDEFGNIMHEIQPGDTLGQVIFQYGYGWDDLDAIRQLNGLEEGDQYNLVVGEILLIPSAEGTYTPTPGDAEATDEPRPTDDPTRNAIVIQSDALEFQITPIDEADLGIIGLATSDTSTSTTQPTESPVPSATVTTPPSSTPLPASTATIIPSSTPVTPTSTPTLAGTEVSWSVFTVTPTPLTVADASNQSGATPPGEVVVRETVPTWLIAALVAQSVVIIGAGIEFWRRRR